jgi:hypothetical protein
MYCQPVFKAEAQTDYLLSDEDALFCDELAIPFAQQGKRVAVDGSSITGEDTVRS